MVEQPRGCDMMMICRPTMPPGFLLHYLDPAIVGWDNTPSVRDGGVRIRQMG